MRKNAYRKEILRSITRPFSRFLAISAIIAVGAGFLAGLASAAPDMRLRGDAYYDETNMMDFQILSTMGLTDEDAEALRGQAGVRTVMPVKYTDLEVQDQGERFLFRVQSLPEGINDLVLLTGRMPEEGKAECVLNIGRTNGAGLGVGDVITIPDETESLSRTEYTVVGVVRSAVYLSFSFGTTNIGDGRLDYVIYVPMEDFTSDYYTEMDLTLTGSEEQNTFSDAYRTAVEAAKDRLTAFAGEREQARYDEIRSEAEEELQKGRDEYTKARDEADQKFAEGQDELSKAEAEIQRSETEIADGIRQYEEGVKAHEDGERQAQERFDALEAEFAASEQEINQAEAELANTKTQLDSSKEELDAARVTLDETAAELRQRENELNDAKAELNSAERELTQTENQLAAAQQALQENRRSLDQTAASLAEKQQTLAEAKAQLDTLLEAADALDASITQAEAKEIQLRGQIEALKAEGREEEAASLEAELEKVLAAVQEYAAGRDQYRGQYQAGMAAYEENYAAFEDGQRAYESGEAAYAGANKEYESARAACDNGRRTFQANLAEYQRGLAALQEGNTEYENGEAAYRDNLAKYQEGLAAWQAGYQEWQDGVNRLASGRKEAEEARAAAEEELERTRKQLRDSKTELDAGKEALESAKEELAGRQADFEEAKAKAEDELADARLTLADSEKQIEEIEFPEWYVLTREENEGYVSYRSDADRIASIATVFPWLFFFVAALVSLTSMTRMVEEDRVLIGTYKALGFSKGKILMKYILYALLASLLGSAAGIAVMTKILPFVIEKAYGIMYTIESPYVLSFHLSYALIATGAAVLCTVGATLVAGYRSLMEVPAALMVPAAPKAGRRILLERVGWLWKRMKFTYKVTARNLFRYKKRLFMTLAGISGCTALLLTGFGIKDSVSGLLELQYGEIDKYDLVIGPDEDEDWKKTEDALAKTGVFDAMGAQLMKTVEIRSDGGNEDVNLCVPEDGERFSKLVVLRSRRSGEAIAFPKEGVILSEKLAKKLKVETGDTVRLPDVDGRYYDVTVEAVTEHYVQDYVYMSRALYEEKAKTEWAPNQIAVICASGADRDAVEQAVRGVLKGTPTLQFVEDQTQVIRDMLDSLNLVILVLILSAGALAFIVLYNLTSINIMERRREIATIKVLGFYEKEVNEYVYRESAVLTVLSCLCGLVLGIFMHRFVIQTVETDIVMFSRTIHGASYLISALLTLVFSWIVNRVTRGKLRKIDMVESLKSVD